MTPRWISRCSTSTAVRPPKVRRIPFTTTTGSGLAAPGSGGTDCKAIRHSRIDLFSPAPGSGTPGWDVSPAAPTSLGATPEERRSVGKLSVGIERHLPSITEDALRPVDHQQHQHQSDQHQPDG